MSLSKYFFIVFSPVPNDVTNEKSENSKNQFLRREHHDSSVYHDFSILLACPSIFSRLSLDRFIFKSDLNCWRGEDKNS